MKVSIGGAGASGASRTLTDQNPTPDVVRVGDGTNQAKFNADGSQVITPGVATSAKQDTGNASLSIIQSNTGGTVTNTGNTASSVASIDTKTPALGQAVAGSSVPVVLPATQITALTPPTTVTVQQPTGTNLHTTVDNFPATQATTSTQLPASLGQKAMAASLPVTIASDQSNVPVIVPEVSTSGSISAVNANLATGIPTANSFVSLTGLQGMSTGVVEVTTIGTSTLAAYVSSDGGTTRVLTPMHSESAVGTAAVTGFTASTLISYKFDITGANAIYIFCTSFTSAPTVTLRASSRSSVVNVSGGSLTLAASSSTIGNVKITDGTTTTSVKAASTAAVATDTAVVVAISPNGSTNTIGTVLQLGGATGSSPGSTALSTTATTFTAPGSAQGFVLQNQDITGGNNVRYRIGATATTTLGQRLLPGESTAFIPTGASVSVIAEAGTPVADIQWIVR